jgi:hypothetical protein
MRILKRDGFAYILIKNLEKSDDNLHGTAIEEPADI